MFGFFKLKKKRKTLDMVMGVVAQAGPIEPRQCFVFNSDRRPEEQ